MLFSPARSDNLYLSPHYDDIAFSLGALVAAQPGGTIVDIFTRSGYVHGVVGHAPPSADEVRRISALRQAEERSFTGRFGLEVIELGLEEPSLRGRGSRDASGVEDDRAQLRAPLLDLLDRLASGRRVFCPAAIGGHVNHLATRAVVLDWARAAPRGTEVLFYEDLPYASGGKTRWRGVRDLRAAAAGWRLRRESWAAGPQKLELINLYRTQHAAPPTSLRRFSPRALWPPGPHEAVWRLLTSS